jgi:hypothetical protein
LYRFATLRIIFWKEVDQVGRILMRPMTGSNIQDPSLRGFSKSPSKLELPTAHRTAQPQRFNSLNC